jgi:hypothetical protein
MRRIGESGELFGSLAAAELLREARLWRLRFVTRQGFGGRCGMAPTGALESQWVGFVLVLRSLY